MPTASNPIAIYTNRRPRAFGDKRLVKKGVQLYEAMSQSKSTCIRAMAKNRAEQVAYYRFLENPNVTSPILLESLRAHCHQQVSERHVLAISDTSEINLQAHAGRLKPEGQGVVGNNTDIGFFYSSDVGSRCHLRVTARAQSHSTLEQSV